MKERGILFSAPMVLALLAGRKTQTRRVVKPQPMDSGPPDYWRDTTAKCPYGQRGDRLWVRETWQVHDASEGELEYRADGARRRFLNDTDPFWEGKSRDLNWRPSIFMPRWASRITLEVTDVRVDRLQEISAEDCAAEGIQQTKGDIFGVDGLLPFEHHYASDAWQAGWIAINGAKSWAANPWVWVVEFRRLLDVPTLTRSEIESALKEGERKGEAIRRTMDRGGFRP